MARPTWLIDGKRIATKIKSASETSDPKKVKWKSNPTRTCPKCDHVIDNNDVTQDWPGLPRGVKFDPTDQELLWHLFAKAGVRDAKRHPFIDEFIPTVDNEDGICYTHPKKLPGVKQDGSAAHFFYRTMKAYNTGSRKRRKIQNDDGRVRWHKTGKTKPVIMDGVHMGQKKIMVLYMSNKGEKDEKTNWVMHQIHIGTEEDEKDGEFVVSKVLYQQQTKQCDRNEHDLQQNQRPSLVKPDPPTPASAVPNPPRSKEHANVDLNQEGKSNCEESVSTIVPDPETENKENAETRQPECEKPNDHDSQTMADLKWSEGDVQFLLDSQQLADGMFLCDEILLSQSSYGGKEGRREKPCLSDYATIGAEHLKKDLEDCQNLSQFDLSNIELDTPPDLRLSQLLGSQESLFS